MDYEEIQHELEGQMVSRGAERYAKDVAKPGGLLGSTVGKKLRRKAYIPMVDALNAPRPRGGKVHAGRKLIEGIDPFIIADIAIRRIIDGAARETQMLAVFKDIAKAIEWHTRDESLADASMAIWNKTQERLKHTTNPAFRRKSIDGTVAGMKEWSETNAPDLAEKLDAVKGVEWDIEDAVAVGSLLVDLMVKHTKLVRASFARRGRRDTKAFLVFTTGTQEWLEQQHEYHSLLRPVCLPMVCPPKPWQGMQEGGYLTPGVSGEKFIKTRARKLVNVENLQDIFHAVNLIQETPWRVNMSIWKHMNDVWQSGSGIGDVPPRFEEDGRIALQVLPAYLADLTTEERSAHEDMRPWKSRQKGIHEHNANLKGMVKGFGDLMQVATQFAQYPAFYHPHKLDWRQRSYPISSFLSPQGDQFNKGLIEFAEGKRMGDSPNSGAWLCIHGANVYGKDKVSFEDRIAWVEENHNEIIESAHRPLDTAFWQLADKPWPFLAFCIEYAAWKISGDDHITHMPVALDGSNSGLQHLSAMLRDPEGARITCVAPGDSPEDVYQMVANTVENEILHRYKGGNDSEWLAIWKGKVTRKIAKQPTMTYCYSATEAGMAGQIENALAKLDIVAKRDGRNSYLEFTDPKQDNKDAAKWLSKLVRRAIEQRMAKAAEAMKFLQKVSSVYTKTGRPMRWTTPLHVPVVQYYTKTRSKRKQVYIDGRKLALRVLVDVKSEKGEQLFDARKSGAGVSPNFVHSMDSTHLLWTVLKSFDTYGIQDFAMIHDSFGTHATACDELAYATREMFVRLYEDDRLAMFRDQIAALLIEEPELLAELPDVPTQGTFDLNTVMDSDYFFA